ncbi:uncharacterized protein LOC130628611 [Hydractinia symbiolongicarpus]|uniref:uncharacterized protein LOC130628611 n=1 Tax=Hydractinia symbiolongicarpus TaxID=13093 RepID=UPI00254A428D|nr:uncharacterized protein LOC130628611 [Hydractinia symbiolongicarpus]
MTFKISPEPNFENVEDVLGLSWPLHYIFFGIFFAILFFYTLINIVNLLRSEKFQRQKIFLTINAMLCFLCFVMASSLFLDPYESGEYIKDIDFRNVLAILAGLREPCIAASFSLIQISLLEATKLQLYSRRLQSYIFISIVIGFHFFLVFTTNFILIVFADTTIFILVCQIYFLLTGFTMTVTSLYSGIKIISQYSTSKSTLQLHIDIDMESSVHYDLSTSEISCPYIINKPTKRHSKSSDIRKVIFQDKSMRRVAGFTISTATFSLGIFAGILYSFSLTTTKTPDPMKWFILQNILRTAEGGMAATMAYIVRRNVSRNWWCKC